jgi:hypothetical protein
MSAEVRQAYRSAGDVSVMACLLTNRDDPARAGAGSLTVRPGGPGRIIRSA